MEQAPAATRDEALDRLKAFVPNAGRAYAAQRNNASVDAVSRLSAPLRHRLIAEPEVLRAVLSQHRLEDAEKFVQEVCWRSYWKGWLEQRPSTWAAYCCERDHAFEQVADTPAYQQAVAGRTGIACFDDWAEQLNTTGHLHNHVRMWVASIWIFTLELPWTLGADWFLSRLLDGDAASNTLSWRWVAGLQTAGKHYLARADNIKKFTGGQYNPVGQLNETAIALTPSSSKPPAAMPGWPVVEALQASDALLLTDEDLSPDHGGLRIPEGLAVAVCLPDSAASPGSNLAQAQHVQRYKHAAAQDTVARLQRAGHAVATPTFDELDTWLAEAAARRLVMPWVPVGATRDRLMALLGELDMPWAYWQRGWDAAVWPHAQRGFFPFKKRVLPSLSELLA